MKVFLFCYKIVGKLEGFMLICVITREPKSEPLQIDIFFKDMRLVRVLCTV